MPGVDVVVTCVGVVGVGTAVGSVTVVESDEVERGNLISSSHSITPTVTL